MNLYAKIAEDKNLWLA